MTMDMHNLYLLLNIGVIAIPLVLSFDKKVHFYRSWKAFFPALAVVATGFLIWDALFTHAGYWGFDERYTLPFRLLGMPLGEWLFFITVPYACVFLYATFKAYFSNWLQRMEFHYLLWLVMLSSIALIFIAGAKPYTLSATIPAIIICTCLLIVRPKFTNALCLTYAVSIIPFLLVNGLLTGTWIEGQVVWYNPSAFHGWRIGTIPVEDMFYSFDLIVLNIVLMEYFSKRFKR